MTFSAFWEAAILDHVYGKTSYTAPAHIYVALSTANPLADGSGMAEPSGNAYARVSTSPSDWRSSTGTPKQISNLNAVNFPAATGDWGTVTYFALFDASTAGNYLASGALNASKHIQNTDTASFATDTLVNTLT
jgi:hypothetical protein